MHSKLYFLSKFTWTKISDIFLYSLYKHLLFLIYKLDLGSFLLWRDTYLKF